MNLELWLLVACNVEAGTEAFRRCNSLTIRPKLLLFIHRVPYCINIFCFDHNNYRAPWSWLSFDLHLFDWRHFPTHWPSFLKQILAIWAESEQRILPLYFLIAPRHSSLSSEADKNTSKEQWRGGQLADILDSTQGMLSLDLDAFSGSEPSTFLWHEACLGVKAQPGVLRVLHSRSVSLGYFGFTLCWKSAEQTQTYKAKGWLYYLINFIFEGLFEAKLLWALLRIKMATRAEELHANTAKGKMPNKRLKWTTTT